MDGLRIRPWPCLTVMPHLSSERCGSGSPDPAPSAHRCGVFIKATGPCFLNAAFALAECSELLAAGRSADGRGPGPPGSRITSPARRRRSPLTFQACLEKRPSCESGCCKDNLPARNVKMNYFTQKQIFRLTAGLKI